MASVRTDSSLGFAPFASRSTSRGPQLETDMALPTFFIIGAAKAGTTSLHHYLDQHPEIQMSAIKEPNFFSGPENGIRYPAAMGRVSSRDEYERLFDPAFPVRGEASVGYTNNPRRQFVPGRIKRLVPDAKFIYIVRDPIARTVSQYQHWVAFEGEHRSLQEALSDLSDPYSPYVCSCLYASQLELYLRYFPQASILVVDQADLLADRPSTLREVFAFLAVDDAVDFSLFDEELNTGRNRVYAPGYLRLVEPLRTSPLRLLPGGFRRSMLRSVERILLPQLPTPVLDDELRSRLGARFAGEVQRLRALTGKEFPTWSL